MAKPFIKYLGGKREHAVIDLLRGILRSRPFKLYVEPFLGGGAVFFALAEALAENGTQSIIGDADGELIALYSAITKNPHAVQRKAIKEVDALSNMTANEQKKYVTSCIKLWNAGDRSPGHQFFLRHATFNGMFRRNVSGEMNVPPRDNLGDLSLPGVPELLDCAQALEGVELVDWDFRQYEDDDGIFIDHETVIYLDPPFDGGFVDYIASKFYQDDQVGLIQLAAEWDARGATVVYSNAKTPFIEQALAEHWPEADVLPILAKRAVSSDGNRDDAPEVIARSPA